MDNIVSYFINQPIKFKEYNDFLKRTDLGSQYPKEDFKKRIEKLLLGAKTYLCGNQDFSRPVPLLIVHTIPLISNDEIEEQLVINQFYQFKSAICRSIGCQAKQET